MLYPRIFAGLAAVLLPLTAVPGALAQTAPSHPPIEAFGTLPSIQQVQISPDGKHLLALQTYKGRTAAVIYEVGAPPGTTPAILIDDMHYIVGAHWLKNDRVLVVIYEATFRNVDDRRAFPYFRAFAFDLKFANPVLLLKDSAFTSRNNSSASVADIWLDDPTHILMPLWAAHMNDVSRDLYSVDVITGKSESVLQGKHATFASSGVPSTLQWIMDGHGHPFARIDRQEAPLFDHLMLLKDGDWKEIAVYDAEADQGADVAGLSDDGKMLIRFDLSEQSGTGGVAGYDIASGKTATLVKDTKFDASGFFRDDWTHRVLGIYYVDDILKTRWFDPSMQALQNGLDAAFPGNNVALLSMNQARDKVTVRVSSTSLPPSYYYLDRITHRASRVGASYPNLRPEDLGTVKPYTYKARDGLEIPAYLTLPPGKTAKNLPVVIFPHGGPEARDAMDFDWWAQFMANRGYAVLQPNFRGSYGYGYAFRKAGFHQWGLKMQDDITDGTLKLIADGIADPRRICIVGGSYGGYAALAGATFTSGLYTCAVSVAGLSDLPKWMTTKEREEGAQSGTMSYLRSRVGDDVTALAAVSPALHADRVSIPILLMHGESDYTVRIDQSIAENDALKRAGKNVKFVRFEGNEDHYLERTETRIAMLTELEKFLKENIGN